MCHRCGVDLRSAVAAGWERQLELLRAVRVVVETGFHHERWSWDRCAAYLAEHQGLPLPIARKDMTRYMVWPGQGVSSMMRS